MTQVGPLDGFSWEPIREPMSAELSFRPTPHYARMLDDDPEIEPDLQWQELNAEQAAKYDFIFSIS